MAVGESSKSPKIERQLVDLTKIAVGDWFVGSGMIGKKGEIKLGRTLESYGLKTPDINKLSLHVIGFVEDKTGVDFKLSAGKLSQFGDASIKAYINGVAKFMAGLPGEPTTLPSKKSISTSALPGEPVTLPGKPRTTPSRPSRKR
jgi:hypothetical protein